jgi:hypothetical protein
MMKTLDFMEQCYLAGLEFEDDGTRLLVRPQSLVTLELAEKIREYKPVILRILKSDHQIDIPCKGCGWRGITFDMYCEWCIDLQVSAERVGEEIVLMKV